MGGSIVPGESGLAVVGALAEVGGDALWRIVAELALADPTVIVATRDSAARSRVCGVKSSPRMGFWMESLDAEPWLPRDGVRGSSFP